VTPSEKQAVRILKQSAKKSSGGGKLADARSTSKAVAIDAATATNCR
jgi:hypothetical protein